MGIIAFIVMIVIIAVLSIILIRIGSTNKKLRPEYDERQKAVAGIGYKYGMFIVMGWVAVAYLFEVCHIEIPMGTGTFCFIGCIAAICIYTPYLIWKDAYLGMNNSAKRYFIMFGAMGIVILVLFIWGVQFDIMVIDGIIQPMVITVPCCIMCFEILIVYYLKQKRDQEKEACNEES